MKYLSVQTFQCGISVSGAATFTGGATINLLALNGATTSSEASLFLGAHGTNEGGQLVLQKGTSNTYAAHLDNYADQFRLLYGTNTGSAGVALAVSLSTRQLILPAYTSTSSFSGTVVGYLAFDSSGNVLTTPVPAGGVTSIIAGTGVSVSSGTGNVTVSIGQSVATSAQVTFDSVITNNNGNGTNLKIGDDVWLGDVNAANTFRVTGVQNGANGYIIFGNANSDALGRSGTGNLTYAGSTVWTAATLTDLSQLTNGPGYITSAALSGYVPTSRTLSINGTSYDLTANRSWTISTVDYTSRLQHQVKAGVAINKGQAVYVTSADGTNMIVGLASNASEATSSKTMGLLDATVSTNGFANVVTEGLLAGLDTSTANAEGDPVWLGTGGNLIYGLANKPSAPAHLVFIGIVTRKNANNGEIFVKVQNGFELNEIHDVDLKTTVPVNGHILGFDGTLWVNKTIASWLGYTPVSGTGTTNYLPKFTGSTSLGNSSFYDAGTPTIWVNSSNANSRFYFSPVHADGRINFNAVAGTNDYTLLRAWHTGNTVGIGNGSTFGSALSTYYDSVLIGTSGALYFMQGTFGPLNVPYRLGISTSATATYFTSGVENNTTNLESNEFIYTAKAHTFRTGTTTGNQSQPNQYTPLFLSTAGNVGIGTTGLVPGYLLTINGGVSITAGQSLSLDPSAGIYMVASSSQFRLYNNSIAALSVASTGNVLVNTTTDSGYKLDINGTARINSSLYVTDPAYTLAGRFYQAGNATTVISGGPAGENITFGPSNRIFINASMTRVSSLLQTAAGLSVGTFNYPWTYGAQAYISGSTTANAGGGRGLYIDSTIVAAANNDVLVGLDINPTFTNGAFTGVGNFSLRAYGYSNFQSGINIYPGNPAINSSGIPMQGALFTWGGGDTVNYYAGYQSGSGFYHKFWTNSTERVRISDGYTSIVSGNLLVGTTTDGGYRLDVNGITRLQGTTLINSQLNISAGPTYAATQLRATTGNTLEIRSNDASVLSTTFFQNGNVLIGTGSDSGYKLDVNGTARIQNNLTISSGNSLRLNNAANDTAATLAYSSTVQQGAGVVHAFGGSGIFGWNGLGLNILHASTGNDVILFNRNVLSSGTTSNQALWFTGYGSFAPTTGTNSFNVINIGTQYNATGGVNTIRGFYYNPVLTSMTGVTHRAIETTSGDVIFNNAELSVSDTGTSGITHNLLFRNDNNSYGGIYISSTGQSLSIQQNSGYGYLAAAGFSILSANGGIWTNNGSVFRVVDSGGTINYFRIHDTTGNVSINSSTDAGYKLYVNGTGYFADNLKLQTGILSFDGVAGYWGNAIKYETSQLNLYQSGELHLGVGGSNITLYKNTKIPHNQRFTAGGYSSTDGITIWGTQNASAGGDGFVGRNLYYNGTNYIYASTNDNSLWGTIAGMRVVGNSSNALEFIARPATNSGLDVVASDLDSYKRMVISYSGNVGIGTLSPDSKLHIEGTTTGTGSGADAIVHIKQNGSWNGNEPWALYVEGYSYLNGFRVNAADGQRGLYTDAAQLGFAVGGNSPISFTQNTSDYRMYIAPGGNIGIGTTAPAQQLHVTQNIALGLTGGSAGDTNNILFPTVNGTHTYAPNGIFYTKKGTWGGQIDIRTSYDWGYATDNAKISLNGAEGNGIVFYTGASALGSTERVRITYDGKVGIGVTSPLDSLQVKDVISVGSVGNAGILYLRRPSDGAVLGKFYNSGNYTILQESQGAGGLLQTGYGTSSLKWSGISGSPRVGIGFDGTLLATAHVQGSGTTSATTALLVENSAATASLTVLDNGTVSVGTSNTGVIMKNNGGYPSLAFWESIARWTIQREGSDVLNFVPNTTHVHGVISFVPGVYTGGVAIGNDTYQHASQLKPASAVLSLYAEAQGFLQPRLSTSQKNAIATPATGLQVYDSTLNKNNLYNGTSWLNIATETWVTSQNYVPQTRTLTINGTSYDLSANRSWTIATTTPGGSDTQFQYNSSGSLAGASALTYNSANNRIGVNQASPGYDFDVNGQVRVQDKLRVGTVNSGNGVVHMSSSATINPNTTTIVWAQNVSVGMCAFIEYYILNNNSLTDQRAGTIMVTWNQSGTPTIAHTETTTPDIGSTTSINFTSSLVGADARINAVNSSANSYTIVMSYKYF